jgi:NADPH:quinone reductase-like Zn-dependent oxidoreductase
LARKPENVTFEQAASIPIAALTALQGLRDKGHVQPGQKILINGAAGGVGTFAVQIAASFGADRVIDYTREDFTRSEQRYDLLFDCIGNRSFSACRRVMNPKGICIVVSGPDGRWLGPLARFLKAVALSPFVSQTLVPMVAKPGSEDLTIVSALVEAGKVMPVIDRRYGL